MSASRKDDNAGLIKRSSWVSNITRYLGRVVLFFFFRLEIRGTDNLPSRDGFVLLPKHQRWEDIPLMSLATPRSLYYIAKNELFSNPFTMWFISSLGGIPLNRKNPLASRRFLKAVLDYLSEGEGIVLFPEGTYYKGEMGPGKVGMVRLILSHIVPPFIPVGVRYEKGCLRTSVKIDFGRPLYLTEDETPDSFLERIMESIAALSGLPENLRTKGSEGGQSE